MNFPIPGAGASMMDPKTLQFWGEALLGAARGQRQMEAASDWMMQGLSLFGDAGVLLRKAWGLDDLFVPKKQYSDLLARFEESERKAKVREERIRQLETLLAKESLGREPLREDMRNLAALQAEQFEELMRTLGIFPGKS